MLIKIAYYFVFNMTQTSHYDKPEIERTFHVPLTRRRCSTGMIDLCCLIHVPDFPMLVSYHTSVRLPLLTRDSQTTRLAM